MGRVADLERLRERLQFWRLWQLALDYSQTGTSERLTVHQSLLAVIEFIEARAQTEPGWRGLDDALVKILVAITDIESGRTVAWLSNPALNRPPPPISVQVLRGRLAGLMQVLMDDGQGRKEAAGAVLRQLPSDSPVLAGTEKTWRTVARWRDNVIGSAEPSVERKSYEAMLALAKRLNGNFPQKPPS